METTAASPIVSETGTSACGSYEDIDGKRVPSCCWVVADPTIQRPWTNTGYQGPMYTIKPAFPESYMSGDCMIVEWDLAEGTEKDWVL